VPAWTEVIHSNEPRLLADVIAGPRSIAERLSGLPVQAENGGRAESPFSNQSPASV
jgi:hypothetical protein